MNRKNNIFRIVALTSVLTLNASLFIALNKDTQKVIAYDAASLPTTIDLNDCGEQEIRSYYSSLNSLSVSERQGTKLLKNLKPILMNNQKYYSYENGESIWKFYEITDRDWVKSPASAITNGTYNANTNIITGYKYGSSYSNPYLHALYINRNVDNQTKAWGDHSQTNWGINREHIWAKSHGFQDEGAGGARGDPMHLWAANGYANNKHSNYFFAFVDKTRSYDDCGSAYSYISNNLKGYSKNAGGNQSVFEPQDSDKGDIARSIFYMVARYNNYAGASSGFSTDNPNLKLVNSLSENSRTGTSTANDAYGMGLMSDLLAWNKLDPVDEYEIHRNNLLYKNFTNNRNPFIDFPNWADAIWGTANLDGTNYNSTITTSASPATDSINVIENNTFSISTHSIELEVDRTADIYATNADGNTSWSIEDDTIASLNKTSTSNNERVTITALKAGTTTITATNGLNSVTCTVTVGKVIRYGTEDDPLSVDEAIEVISLTGTNETAEPLYVRGIVTSNSAYNTTYKNYDEAYLQNNDGSDDQAFQLFRFKLSGVSGSYSAANSMAGKQVLAYGYGKVYDGQPELTTSSNTPKNPLVIEITDPEPTGIILDKDEASVDVGDTLTLTASLIPNNIVSNIIWESSDENIATVNNGVVTGISNGQATITAIVEGTDFEAECLVTVTGEVPIGPSDYLTNTTSFMELTADESVVPASETITKTTNELVEENDWTISSGSNVYCYTSFDIDSNINISTTGAATCGSVWGSTTNDWRLYQNKSGNIIITADSGCLITSIKLVYNISSNGILKYGNTTLSSNTAVAISSLSSVTFTVANSGSATNGQVRITSFSVTYSHEKTVVDSVAINYGAYIPRSDWNAINELEDYQITDYGCMLVKKDTLVNNYQLSSVEEAYNNDESVYIANKGSGATPNVDGDNYYFYIKLNVTRSSNYDVTYVAVPFIKVNDVYYFLDEVECSVSSLANDYLTNGGSSLSTDALNVLIGN